MPDDLRDQFPIVREIIGAFEIPIYQLQGFEADDLIAALVKQAEAARRRDDDRVGRPRPAPAGQRQDDADDHARRRPADRLLRPGARSWSATASSRGQMIDFKALKGDTTDNIPGIPGVGEKTAAKLVQDYGSLDGIYDSIDAVQPEKLRAKLAEHRDDVFRWRELVTVRQDLPIELDLEAARLGDYDRDEVLRLFREYEFRSLVERLPGLTGEETRAPGELLREADRLAPVPAASVAGRPSAAERAAAGGRRRARDAAQPRSRSHGSAAAAAAVGNGHLPEQATEVVDDATGRDRASAGCRAESSARERLAALIADPSICRGRSRASATCRSGWRRSRTLTVGVALTDQRPRRGDLLGLAVADGDGRIVSAGPDRAPEFAAQVLSAGKPLVGHEIKQLLVWELARRDPTATGNVLAEASDLPAVAHGHADRGVRAQCRAAQPDPGQHLLGAAGDRAAARPASSAAATTPRSRPRPWPPCASRSTRTSRPTSRSPSCCATSSCR